MYYEGNKEAREKRRQLHKRMKKQKDIFLIRFLREL